MLMVLAGVPIPITLVVGGMLLAIALATEW